MDTGFEQFLDADGQHCLSLFFSTAGAWASAIPPDNDGIQFGVVVASRIQSDPDSKAVQIPEAVAGDKGREA
ncbi:MAG: hypothetical protein AB7O66_22410 [Limisphaerales bacterium]